MSALHAVFSNACTCEAGFEHVENMPPCNCYTIGGFSDQPTAQMYCKSLGAVLAVPETQSQVAILSSYVRRNFLDGAHRDTWLGYVKKHGIFVNNLTGQEMPREIWDEGEPNNSMGGQDCTWIPPWSVERVDDVQCFLKKLALCQKSCCTTKLL